MKFQPYRRFFKRPLDFVLALMSIIALLNKGGGVHKWEYIENSSNVL